jgi:hypothetical protein
MSRDVESVLRGLIGPLIRQVTIVPGDMYRGGEGTLLCTIQFADSHQIFVYKNSAQRVMAQQLQAQWMTWDHEKQENIPVTARLYGLGLFELLQQFAPTMRLVLEWKK